MHQAPTTTATRRTAAVMIKTTETIMATRVKLSGPYGKFCLREAQRERFEARFLRMAGLTDQAARSLNSAADWRRAACGLD